jgi:hypothetical protein
MFSLVSLRLLTVWKNTTEMMSPPQDIILEVPDVHGFFCFALVYFEPLYQPFFVKGFFKVGFRELFTWTGFEP